MYNGMQDFASMKILNSVFALFGSGRGREVSILGSFQALICGLVDFGLDFAGSVHLISGWPSQVQGICPSGA